MNVNSRIDKLERQESGDACAECGYAEGQLIESFVILPDSSERAPREKSYATCGRGLVFTIDLGGGGEPLRVPEATATRIEKVYGNEVTA